MGYFNVFNVFPACLETIFQHSQKSRKNKWGWWSMIHFYGELKEVVGHFHGFAVLLVDTYCLLGLLVAFRLWPFGQADEPRWPAREGRGLGDGGDHFALDPLQSRSILSLPQSLGRGGYMMYMALWASFHGFPVQTPSSLGISTYSSLNPQAPTILTTLPR